MSRTGTTTATRHDREPPRRGRVTSVRRETGKIRRDASRVGRVTSRHARCRRVSALARSPETDRWRDGHDRQARPQRAPRVHAHAARDICGGRTGARYARDTDRVIRMMRALLLRSAGASQGYGTACPTLSRVSTSTFRTLSDDGSLGHPCTRSVQSRPPALPPSFSAMAFQAHCQTLFRLGPV